MRSGSLFIDPADSPLVNPPKRKRGAPRRSAEDEFAFSCRAMKLPEFAREYRFAKSIGRKWRFDFAFGLPGSDAPYQVAVEIEGIVVTTALVGGKKRLVSLGRHAHADGFREDMRKYSTAAALGWTVIRFDPQMVKKGEAIEMTMRVLSARGWEP